MKSGTGGRQSIETASVRATERAAAELGRLLQLGDVVGLVGPLGAGKTCFVRGLARGMGLLQAKVTSPTFTLVHEYRGATVSLFHVDLYRIERALDLGELGLEEYMEQGVCAIEWIDRFVEVAPPEWLEVDIEIRKGGRHLVPRGVGVRGQALAQAWLRPSAKL